MDTPLLVEIILCATSLGVLVPVLKDSGEISSTFGQLIIAAASIADFGAIILLTIFFSGVFFVTSGVRFDLHALTASASNLAMVPVFLVAPAGRARAPRAGVPPVLDAPHTAIAGILQATSLPFIVAATAIGMDLGLIDAAASAALVGAGCSRSCSSPSPG